MKLGMLVTMGIAATACAPDTQTWPISATGRLGFQSVDRGAFRIVDVASGTEHHLQTPESGAWLWLDHGESLAFEGFLGDFNIIDASSGSGGGVLAPVNDCGPAPDITPSPSGTRVAISWRRRCAALPVLEIWQRTPNLAGWELIAETGNPFSADLRDVHWDPSGTVFVFVDVYDAGHTRAEMHKISEAEDPPTLVSLKEYSTQMQEKLVYPRPSPDGSVLLVAKLAMLWGPTGSIHLSDLIVGLDWHPSGDSFSAVTSDGLLWAIDTEAGTPVPASFHPEGTTLIGWSSDGEHIALVEPCERDAKTRVVFPETDVATDCMHRLRASWSPEHPVLAVEGNDRVLLVDPDGNTADLGPGRAAMWAP